MQFIKYLIIFDVLTTMIQNSYRKIAWCNNCWNNQMHYHDFLEFLLLTWRHNCTSEYWSEDWMPAYKLDSTICSKFLHPRFYHIIDASKAKCTPNWLRKTIKNQVLTNPVICGISKQGEETPYKAGGRIRWYNDRRNMR